MDKMHFRLFSCIDSLQEISKYSLTMHIFASLFIENSIMTKTDKSAVFWLNIYSTIALDRNIRYIALYSLGLSMKESKYEDAMPRVPEMCSEMREWQ